MVTGDDGHMRRSLTEYQPMDWPNDPGGDYLCQCCDCGQVFVGSRDRVECRICAKVDSTSIPVIASTPTECPSCETLRREVMHLQAQLRTRHPYAVFDVNQQVERERHTRNGGKDHVR